MVHSLCYIEINLFLISFHRKTYMWIMVRKQVFLLTPASFPMEKQTNKQKSLQNACTAHSSQQRGVESFSVTAALLSTFLLF